MRNRTKGTKLDGTFDKKRGAVVGETKDTVTTQNQGEKQPMVYAKRDIAKVPAAEKRPKSEQSRKAPAKKTEKRRVQSVWIESPEARNRLKIHRTTKTPYSPEGAKN